MYFLVNACEDITILRVIYFIKMLLKIVFLVVPVILVIMAILDLIKAMTGKNIDVQNKNIIRCIKRFVFSILLFFVPSIVSLVMGLIPEELGASTYKECYENATLEKINQLEEDNTLVELRMNDYKEVYFFTNSDNCPDGFSSSNNVANNKKGCIATINNSDNVYWYVSESNKYCLYHWEFASIKDRVSGALTNASGCILTRNNSGSGATVIPGAGGNVTWYDTNNTIFIGDSRTVGINKLNKNSKDIFIAKEGVGISFLGNDTISRLKEILNNSDEAYNIVIYLGINDLGNSASYVEKFNEIKNMFPNHNLTIVSVTAVDEEKEKVYNIKNSNIETFNSTIKNGLNSNIKYCDIYNKVDVVGNTTDGLHYNANTYEKIYNLIKECLK